MKKNEYIRPVCVSIELETSETIMANSINFSGGNTSDNPDVVQGARQRGFWEGE